MSVAVLRMLTIVCVSAVLGAVHIEAFRDVPWVPDEAQVIKERQKQDDTEAVRQHENEILAQAGIDTPRFQELIDSGALIIDARLPDEFMNGYVDAPFVVNIDPDAFYEHQSQLAQLIAQGVPMVLYCRSLECDDSEILYKRMQDTFGELTATNIYAPGWDGIVAEGIPTTDMPADDVSMVIDQCLVNFYAMPAEFDVPQESLDDQPAD